MSARQDGAILIHYIVLLVVLPRVTRSLLFVYYAKKPIPDQDMFFVLPSKSLSSLVCVQVAKEILSQEAVVTSAIHVTKPGDISPHLSALLAGTINWKDVRTTLMSSETCVVGAMNYGPVYSLVHICQCILNHQEHTQVLFLLLFHMFLLIHHTTMLNPLPHSIMNTSHIMNLPGAIQVAHHLQGHMSLAHHAMITFLFMYPADMLNQAPFSEMNMILIIDHVGIPIVVAHFLQCHLVAVLRDVMIYIMTQNIKKSGMGLNMCLLHSQLRNQEVDINMIAGIQRGEVGL